MRRELADGQLVRILPEYDVPEEGAIYIVHPSSRHVPNKTRAVTDKAFQGTCPGADDVNLSTSASTTLGISWCALVRSR